MANENKFRRLQCEQACENKVGKAKCFALEPLEYLNNFGVEIGSISGGNSLEELEIQLNNNPATIEQLMQAYDENKFDVIVVTYDDGMDEETTYSTVGYLQNMSYDDESNQIGISIDSNYLTNVGSNSGVSMAGYIRSLDFIANEALVKTNGLIADDDNSVVSFHENVGAYSPISCRASFYKL